MPCYGKQALDSVQVLNLGFQVCFGGNATLGLMYRGDMYVGVCVLFCFKIL